MKVIVTGGAGFIGTNLLIHLLKQGNYQVFCLDSLTYASNNFYKKLQDENPGNFNFLKIDIASFKDVEHAMHKICPDRIMHLAAESHVDNSISRPDLFLKTNILGTFNLLESVRTYLSNEKKDNFLFHHISTDEVYGDLNIDDDPFDESSPYRPSSPYSASKASSDHLVRAWSRTYGIPSIITNCSNNFGPFQNKEKFIPQIILNLLRGKQVSIYGDGTNIRDWLYVKDHVEALEVCMRKGVSGETYNIGGNHEMQNIDLFNLISSEVAMILGKDEKQFKNLVSFVKDRPGHDKRYAINMEKIKNSLAWHPKYNFSSALKETIQWYIDN